MSYSYTDRGTLHQRADGSMLETFTYDALGNLTRVERNGAPDIDYVIDAKGRRVGKRVDGSLRKQYIWGGALRVVTELNRDGAVASRFIYGNSITTPDLIVRRGTGSPDRLYRVISDHLGSPVYVVNVADPSDVWLDATYDEWGNVTKFVLDGVEKSDTSDWPIPQGFAGGLYDADTGLVRFGVRDYDPRIGRWTAKDPILFEGGQGNLYVYAGNDPFNFLDPTGKSWAAVAGAAAGAAVGGAVGWATGGDIGAAMAGGAMAGLGAAYGPGGAAAGGILGAFAEQYLSGQELDPASALLSGALNVGGSGIGAAVARRLGLKFAQGGLLVSSSVREVAAREAMEEEIKALAAGSLAGFNIGVAQALCRKQGIE